MPEQIKYIPEIKKTLNKLTWRLGLINVMVGMALVEEQASNQRGILGEIQGSLAHPLLGYTGALIGASILASRIRAVRNTVAAASAMAMNFAAEHTQDVLHITSHNFTTDWPETIKDATFAGVLGLGAYMATEGWRKKED